MAKPALGTKRICGGCAAKFYDLGKDPIVCPTCETVFVIPKPVPARGGRTYASRGAYDPNAEPARAMGTLKEADVADDAGEKEDSAVVAIEDVEVDDADAGGVPMLEELDEK